MKHLFERGYLNYRDAAYIFIATYVIVLAFHFLIGSFYTFDKGEIFFIDTFLQDMILMILIVVVLYKVHRQTVSYIYVCPISYRAVVSAFFMGILMLMAMNMVMVLMNQFLPNGVPAQNVEAIFSFGNSPTVALFASLFITSICAPIVEEMFFRGFLYRALRNDMSVKKAVFFSSLCFALAHGDIYRFIPLFIAGYGLHYISLKYQSILASMIAHSVWNGISVLMQFVVITNR